jgi:hypothetical protein
VIYKRPDRKESFGNEEAYLNMVRAAHYRAERHYAYMAASRDIRVSNYQRWGMSEAAAVERAGREYGRRVEAYERDRKL